MWLGRRLVTTTPAAGHRTTNWHQVTDALHNWGEATGLLHIGTEALRKVFIQVMWLVHDDRRDLAKKTVEDCSATFGCKLGEFVAKKDPFCGAKLTVATQKDWVCHFGADSWCELCLRRWNSNLNAFFFAPYEVKVRRAIGSRNSG